MFNKSKNKEIYTIENQKITINDSHSNGFIYTINDNVIAQMIDTISSEIRGK